MYKNKFLIFAAIILALQSLLIICGDPNPVNPTNPVIPPNPVASTPAAPATPTPAPTTTTSAFTTPETWCNDSNGKVITSNAQFNGNINGLEAQFCFISNGSNLAMIDLQTLTSDKPSIAATYITRGVDMMRIPKKTIWQFCEALKGTSIGFYSTGGWTNPQGVDEICVFPDGSKISTWTLYYISNGNAEYLGIRSRIRSPPLAIKLPYLGYLGAASTIPSSQRQTKQQQNEKQLSKQQVQGGIRKR
jgi:hypothetical protein